MKYELKARIVRVRPSLNAKIADVEWFYRDEYDREHIALNDGISLAPDATDEDIAKAVRDRAARVRDEVGPLIPDVEMNAGVVGKEVAL